MAEIKTWAVTYAHPVSGKLVKAHEFGTTKEEALQKARKSNVKDQSSGKLWEIVSIKEVSFN